MSPWPERPPAERTRPAGEAGDGGGVGFVERFALERRLGEIVELLAVTLLISPLRSPRPTASSPDR